MKRPRLATLKPRIAVLDQRIARPATKITDPQYSTGGHKRWAAEVIWRSGGRCQGCGAEGVRLVADHFRELKDGGAPLDPANGQALCWSCHTRKTHAARDPRYR